MAKVTIKGEPTALSRFLYRHWVIGVLSLPFLYFVPAKWLVTIKTESVRHG